MIKTKVAFLEDRLLSSQSQQFKKYEKALIGWKKADTLQKNQKSLLHDQNKSDFFGRPAFFSQSGLFENFSDCSDWLDKSRPSKKATIVLIV